MASKTVLVSGCFDLLHGGHVEFLAQAKALGTRLVVCVPTDEVIQNHKRRRPALPLEHRVEIIKALSVVDQVVIGDDLEHGLNFQTKMREIKPDILAVTMDDEFEESKRRLCAETGAQYVQLPKTLTYVKVSSTSLRNYIKAPEKVPLRVDFGGGWLDVPRFADPDSYVVNCAVTPAVSLAHWGYRLNGGLGGSAAYKILLGEDAFQSELGAGVGWQDPAVITETGLCAWVPGPRPTLKLKSDGKWLHGRMAVAWQGKPHNTPSLANNPRDLHIISNAGLICYRAVVDASLSLLAAGINTSYEGQRREGMEPLSDYGQLAQKYCGGGFGGYGLFLFAAPTQRDAFVNGGEDRIAVEPFVRQAGQNQL